MKVPVAFPVVITSDNIILVTLSRFITSRFVAIGRVYMALQRGLKLLI